MEETRGGKTLRIEKGAISFSFAWILLGDDNTDRGTIVAAAID